MAEGVEVGRAYVTVLPNATGFASTMQSAIVPAATTSGALAGKKMGSGLLGGIKAVAGPIAALFAVTKIVDFFGDSIKGAEESSKIMRVTEQVIKATGGTAKISAAQVNSLAGALSNKSGVDDEVIQSGANLLLTFKNVRNEAGKGNAVFNRATAAAVDLSATGFGSVEGSSKMLGKALNDPVKGISALSRAGVTFSDDQKKQIKTWVEHGDTLKAQKAILKEVESQVGGTAAASANMSDKMNVAWGNFQEDIGAKLLPILDQVGKFFMGTFLPAAREGIDAAIKFGGTVGNLASRFDEWKGPLTAVATVLGAVLLPVIISSGVAMVVQWGAATVAAVVGSATQYASHVKTVAGWVMSGAAAVASGAETLAIWALLKADAIKNTAIMVGQMVKQAAQWLILKGAQIASAVATGAVTAAQWLLNAAMSANPIGLIILAVVALVAAFVYLWNTNEGFRNFFINAWKGIQAAAKAVSDWFKGTLAPAISAVWNGIVTFITNIPKRFMAGLAAIGKLAGQMAAWVLAAKDAAVNKFMTLVSWVAGLPGRVLSALGGLATVLVNRGRDLIEGLRDGIVNKWESLKDWLGNLPGKLVSAVGGLASKLSSAGHDLVEGLWGGISNGYGWIKGKISGWVGDVVAFIKRLFGIGSPSKVMRQEVGKWLPAGIGEGITDNAQAALNPMLSLSTALSTASQASAPGAASPYASRPVAGDQYTIYEATDAAAVAADINRRQLVMRG